MKAVEVVFLTKYCKCLKSAVVFLDQLASCKSNRSKFKTKQRLAQAEKR